MKLSILPALLLPLSLSAQETWVEDFDAPGTSWSATLFSDAHPGFNTALTREPLTVIRGAPDTVPPLPINAGGDAEGRMFETAVPASDAFALTANVPESHFRDGALSLHAAFGVTSAFGDQSVGPLLRASIRPVTGRLDAYTALLTRTGGRNNAVLLLARWRNGVITLDEVFAESDLRIDPDVENYRIEFEVVGTRLAARLWRITAAGGRLVLAPVVISGGSGPLGNELVAHDAELRTGRAGIRFFTRSTNSVFVDDIVLKAKDPSRGSSSGLLSAPALPPWLRLPWTPLTSAFGSSGRAGLVEERPRFPCANAR